MLKSLLVLVFAVSLSLNIMAEKEPIKDLNELEIAEQVKTLRTSNTNALVLGNSTINLEPYIYYSNIQAKTSNGFTAFKPFKGKSLKDIRNYGQVSWWYLKVSTKKLTAEQQFFLQIGNNKVSELYLYYLKNNEIINTHTAGLNFNNPTTFLSPNLLVPIQSEDTLEILIKMPPCYTMLDMNMSVNISSQNLPLSIIPAEEKIKGSLTEFFSYGFFCGYFLLYLFVVSQLITSFNGSLRFLFLQYSISGGLALIAITGIGYKFIWIDAPFIESIAVSTFSNLFILGSFMFFIRVAPILWQIKWVRPVYYLCVTIVCINIVGTFFSKLLPGDWFPVKWFWYFNDFRSLGFIFCNAMFVIGLYSYWLKVKDKRVLPIITVYFLLVVSLSATVLNSLQIISSLNTYKYVYVLTLLFAAALTWYLLHRIEILNYRILLRNENRLKAIDVGVNLERKRWSNELHDSIGGVISLATLKLSNLESQANSPQNAEELKALRLDLTKAWQEVNTISKNMLPENLQNFGLVEALKQYVQNLNLRSLIKIETYFKTTKQFKNEVILLHIYRIIQELLHNSLKHSKAGNIKLQVYEFNHQLNLSEEDDGIGFDIQQIETSDKQTGLSNLRKRIKLTGGTIEIESNKKRGSFIHFSYPLKVLKEPYSAKAE